MAADLALFNIGIILFAVIPLSTLEVEEVLLSMLAAFNTVGVVAHARNPRHGWYGWTYLTSGYLGALAFLAYEFSVTGVPLAYRLGIGAFLLSGAASGYSAHLVDGGPRWRERR